MDATAFDLRHFAWLDHESIEHPEGHARSLELFRDSVVRPSLLAIDREIEEVDKSDEDAAACFRGDLEDLFQATVEGYVLAVQSMWERALRSLLIAREKMLCQGAQRAAIEQAPWSGGRKPNLQQHFERLLGVPITAFDSFEDLDLLQNLGSAIRHGDGAAARKVHERAPSLWWNWLPPGESVDVGPFNFTVPSDWPEHPSFGKVTLTQAVLEQMIQSVTEFWVDLESMRCNSFKRKSESVQRRLDAWPAERARRKLSRFWTPG
jgi:hypothetical protein